MSHYPFVSIVASSFASGEPAPAPTPTPMENVGNAIVSGVNTVIGWLTYPLFAQ